MENIKDIRGNSPQLTLPGLILVQCSYQKSDHNTNGINALHGDECGDGELPCTGGGDGDGEDGEEQGHHGGTVQLTMN